MCQILTIGLICWSGAPACLVADTPTGTGQLMVFIMAFIKLNRTKELEELLKHPNEWVLLTLIAYRAARTENRYEKLSPGQAKIGDYKNYGMSLQNYRTAKRNLEEWRLVTFKPTNKGTIATLLDSSIYDINPQTAQQTSEHSTNKQPTNKVTTNKNDKKEKNKKKPSLSLKERELQFYNELIPYATKYTKEMVRDFYDYWREPNRQNTKMKYELQKTWSLGLRLERWKENNFKGNAFPVASDSPL